MKYVVVVREHVAEQIRQLPREIRRKIGYAIHLLGDDPRPLGYKKLKGSDTYRIRVGDYRVLYEIQDRALIVSVSRAAHRRELYRR